MRELASETNALVIDGNIKSRASLNRGALLSTQSLYEFSVIIWVVDGIVAELNSDQGAFDQAMAYRMAEVRQWVEDGHDLIVVGPSALAVYKYLPNGTVRAARVSALYPMGQLLTKHTEGSKLEVAPQSTAAATLVPFLNRMTYRATFDAPELIPLVFAGRATAGERSVVGGVLQNGKGNVFFIPNCSVHGDSDDKFYRALLKLPHLVKRTVEQLPDWTSRFRNKAEISALSRVADLNSQLSKIEAAIAIENLKLSEAEKLKHLMSGTGIGFAEAVRSALTEIGFNAVDGPNSRADLIASVGQRYCAIEAKGIEGPVKERQYRQLERWMSELNSALHSEPEELKADPEISRYAQCVREVALPNYDGAGAKGILIVGVFRNLELGARKDPDFPDTVKRLLGRTDTCAMTGVQLYGLVMEARAQPQNKAAIINEMLSTNGILARCSDWTAFLSSV